jgi:hypothetical protein
MSTARPTHNHTDTAEAEPDQIKELPQRSDTVTSFNRNLLRPLGDRYLQQTKSRAPVPAARNDRFPSHSGIRLRIRSRYSFDRKGLELAAVECPFSLDRR